MGNTSLKASQFPRTQNKITADLLYEPNTPVQSVSIRAKDRKQPEASAYGSMTLVGSFWHVSWFGTIKSDRIELVWRVSDDLEPKQSTAGNNPQDSPPCYVVKSICWRPRWLHSCSA